MFKLIGFIVAALPVVLLVRAIFKGIFKGRAMKTSQAFADLKRQIDYVVWAILVMIGCGVVYSVAKLVLTWGHAATP